MEAVHRWSIQLTRIRLGCHTFHPLGTVNGTSGPTGISHFQYCHEYEALHGLRNDIALNADSLHVYCDSQLVVNQISGEYAAKDEKMLAYLAGAKRLL